jgi:hypothetical protein
MKYREKSGEKISGVQITMKIIVLPFSHLVTYRSLASY